LHCNNNQLTTLPDNLPASIFPSHFYCDGNPQLHIKYPNLFNDTYSPYSNNMPDKIAYINAINEKERKQGGFVRSVANAINEKERKTMA
jgi:hypothetical protein